jgi:hypothetical protein
LARLKKAEKYAVLGIDRLLHLMSVTKGWKDIKNQDPIGTFFEKFKIPFNPENETPLEEFKNQVDIALELNKAEKAGLQLDPELIEGLIKLRKSLTSSDLEELKRIKDSNGEPNIYLGSLVENGGQKEKGSKNEKKPESFNKLRARMQQTIQSIQDSNELPDDIDADEIQSLIDALLKLKEILDN